MNHKAIEAEMFRLIREHAKHIEVWLPIPGFDNYQVSSKGRVQNIITRKILKPQLSTKGYHSITLINNDSEKIPCRIHRLVGLAFIPNEENKPFVDHIDRNRTNNNLSNLRWVTNSENGMNGSLRKNNTSGIAGVFWDKNRNKWVAKIKINRKGLNLGRFNTIEEAQQARIKAVKELFKEFANVDEFK